MIRRLAIAAALVLLSAPALAQKGARQKAERLFRAGEQAYEAGRYEMAAEAFEKAYESLPLPAIAFSAAQAHRLQYFVDKDPPELKRAIELYRVYIERVPKGGRRDDAAANLAELEPILERLETEQAARGGGPIAARPEVAPSTRLMVSSPAPGARGTIDGGEERDLPLVQEVAPGAHQVRVRAEGYRPLERTCDVVAGQLRVVEANLEALPARVRLRTESGAQIRVDGRPVGAAPLSRPLELPAGTHRLAVTRRGREPWSREVSLERGEEVEIRADLVRTGQRSLSYVVFGGAAASFAGAGVTSLLALRADGDASDLDQKRRTDGPLTLAEQDRLLGARARRDDRLDATYVLLGVGGALAAGGALLWFLDTPRAERPPPRPSPADETDPTEEGMQPVSVAPVFWAGGAGVALGGRF